MALLAAITAIAVGIASLVFIAWDLIFNDGRYLARFERWLAGFTFFQWAQQVDRDLTAWLSNTWSQTWDSAQAIRIGNVAFQRIAAGFRTFFTAAFYGYLECNPQLFPGRLHPVLFRNHTACVPHGLG